MAALVIAIVWVLSPIKLPSESLPVIGPLDDVVAVVLLLRYVADEGTVPHIGRPGQRPRRSHSGPARLPTSAKLQVPACPEKVGAAPAGDLDPLCRRQHANPLRTL